MITHTQRTFNYCWTRNEKETFLFSGHAKERAMVMDGVDYTV